MVKVDTVCMCLRLAPLGILVAVHCSGGHWRSDDEARHRALRYGFSVELFSERPLSVLTHIFVHISTEHLLSNVFSLASTLLEFGGEDSIRDNVEEDELPVVATRSLGSLVVMTLGGMLGGLGGQLLYNRSKVAQRKKEAQRLLSEKQRLRRREDGGSWKERETVVGEPRKGMSKIRKPNMSRLWTDDGSLLARSFLEQKAAASGRGSTSAGAEREATRSALEQQPEGGLKPSESSAARRRGAPSTFAESYTAGLRARVIQKMRGFIDPDDGAMGHETRDDDAYHGSSASASSSSPGSAGGGGGGPGAFLTRTLRGVYLSAQAWNATKAAEAQALLSRRMLMCGASAGVCALSGFNLTYYRRPVTALCLAVPEVVLLVREFFHAEDAIGVWKTLLPGQTVGHAAHVGGFLVGCVMGCVWHRLAPLSRERGRQRKAEKRRRQREDEERAASQQWHTRETSHHGA